MFKNISHKKMLIALADDDEDDRCFFTEVLTDLKIFGNLLLFKNGEELWDYLNNPHNVLPDIIFLDLNMPIMGGIAALRKIKEDMRLTNIYIAIYSTSSAERDIEETFVQGANIYMVKPHSMIQLRSNLQKILTTSWQYSNSNLDQFNFVLKI